MGRGLLWFAAVVAAIAPSRADAGQLKVRLLSLSCRDEPRLEREILEKTREVMASRADLTLIVLRETSGDVTLMLMGTPRFFERRMAFSREDCHELPTMVGLVLRSWLGQSWAVPDPEPPPPREVFVSSVESAPVPREAASRGLGVALQPMLGMGLDPSSGWVPAVALEVELAPLFHPRFGAVLQGRYDGPYRVHDASGGLRADVVTVAPLLRAGWPLGALVRGELMTGPVLEWIGASSGAPGGLSRGLFRFEWMGVGRLGVPLTEALSLDVSGSLAFRGRELRITSGETLLRFSPVRMGLFTGLRWEIF